MKSVFKRQICTTCLKLSEAFICRGCRQPFCARHVSQHRDKIAKEMENLVNSCEQLRNDSRSEKFAQEILSNIDQWEKDSIEKIRAAAQTARTTLRPCIERIKAELEVPFQKMMNEIQARRKLQDYTEMDMKRWTKQLTEFNEQLKQLPVVQYLDDDDSEAVHFIRIVDRTKQQSSCEAISRYSISERSINSSEESVGFERETFGELFGAITLSDNDHVATYGGPWLGDASVCGTNTYSSGVHHLRFRIIEKFYQSPFFGIVTASQPMVEHMVTCPSANGWSSFDFPVINGKDEPDAKDRLIRSGDAITLTLDCERRQILFRHVRTNRLLHLPVDIRVCPFPWKLLIVLRRKGDCVRLRGGALSLTTADLIEKLPDHLKS